MRQTDKRISRRQFVKGTGGALATFWIVPRHVLGQGQTPPSEKLNIACIGVGGRGGASVNGVQGETIVAMCDVDMDRAGKTFEQYPAAKKYRDFRVMFDEMSDKIDAVTVATPDHTHSVAAMAAIKRGKHVFCEKPLAHTIHEVRALMDAAREHQVVTQLGNQGHSFDTIRTFCEWIWDGAIGQVTEVHACCGSNYSRIDALPKLKERPEIPEELDWDLWQGPAQERPFHPMFVPGSWRGWTPYGCGVIGDWVCHVVDPVFWALDLGAPKTIQAKAQGYDPAKHGLTFPAGTVVTYEFAAKGDRGPVTLYWYDGAEIPPRPDDLEPGRRIPEIGAIVIGEKGKMTYGSHGAGGVRIFPEEKMRAYKRPPKSLPRVKSHHGDWLNAIKSGTKAGSNFDYGGPLTEIALLGIIATRKLGEKLQWDAENAQFTNGSDANQYIRPTFREGWTL